MVGSLQVETCSIHTEETQPLRQRCECHVPAVCLPSKYTTYQQAKPNLLLSEALALDLGTSGTHAGILTHLNFVLTFTLSSPASPWVMPKCGRRNCAVTPSETARHKCVTAVRANGTSAVLPAPPPLQQMCLYVSPSQSLTSAGTPPSPSPLSLPRHSGMYWRAALAGERPARSSFESKPIHLSIPLQIYVTLYYPKGQWSGSFCFMLTVLEYIENICKTVRNCYRLLVSHLYSLNSKYQGPFPRLTD